MARDVGKGCRGLNYLCTLFGQCTSTTTSSRVRSTDHGDETEQVPTLVIVPPVRIGHTDHRASADPQAEDLLPRLAQVVQVRTLYPVA